MKKTAMIFSGMGAQWTGMGKMLFKQNLHFRMCVLECQSALAEISSLDIVSYFSEEKDSMPDMEKLQLIIFSIQMGIYRILNSWEVYPSAVVGHSLGEVSAACAAGILSIKDAITVVRGRSKNLYKIQHQGSMMMLMASYGEVQKIINENGNIVDISGVNSEKMTSISGRQSDLALMEKIFTGHDMTVIPMNVDVPFHGRFIDPLLPELESDLANIQHKPSTIKFFSAVTGELFLSRDFSLQYWSKNLRQPVMFWNAVAKMKDEGIENFLEIAPHTVLASAVGPQCIKSLIKNQDEQKSLETMLLELKKAEIQMGEVSRSPNVEDYLLFAENHYKYFKEIPSPKELALIQQIKNILENSYAE